jgi:hypothetical protein
MDTALMEAGEDPLAEVAECGSWLHDQRRKRLRGRQQAGRLARVMKPCRHIQVSGCSTAAHVVLLRTSCRSGEKYMLDHMMAMRPT